MLKLNEGNRSAKGLGTTRQRTDGRWEYRFVVDVEGIPERRSIYAKTQKEAITRGKKLQEQYTKGLVPKKDKRTLRAFAEDWLARKERAGKAPNTIKNYRLEVGYILPMLGDMRLQAVKPMHVRKLLDKLGAEGKQPRTLRKVRERLAVLFKEALKLELVYRNPVEAVEVEAPAYEPIGRTLEPGEIETLLTACENHPTGLFFRLLLGCGLRKGEALALTWGDVNLEAGEMSITKGWTGSKAHMSATKTRRSRRIVPLPSGLLARFQAQYQDLLKDFTPESVSKMYIFGDPAKNVPYHPTSPNTALQRICIKTGLKPFRCHDLRHTYGSLMLARKVPLEVVSERLGHSTVTTTMNIYRHLLEEERRGYVFDVEDVLSNRPRHSA